MRTILLKQFHDTFYVLPVYFYNYIITEKLNSVSVHYFLSCQDSCLVCYYIFLVSMSQDYHVQLLYGFINDWIYSAEDYRLKSTLTWIKIFGRKSSRILMPLVLGGVHKHLTCLCSLQSLWILTPGSESASSPILGICRSIVSLVSYLRA